LRCFEERRVSEWRFGPGPVFTADLVRQGRRWQTYAIRTLVLLGILATMLIGQSLRYSNPGRPAPTGFRAMAHVGAQLFETFAIAQLTLVLFVAPAMSAGILIPERNRGTLFHILMTDLSATEIVLAKYAGKVVPILALIAAAFPLTALLVLLGGIDPARVLALGMLLVACALLVPAVFLVMSLFLKRVADLLSLGYLLLCLWSLVPLLAPFRVSIPGPIGQFIHDYSPFTLARFIAGFGRTASFRDVAGFFFVAIALSALCLAFASWRLRPMTLAEANRGAEASPRRRFRFGRRRGREPDLDARPILWLEWARNRRGLALRLHRLTLYAGVGLAVALLISDLYSTGLGARVGAVFTLAVALPIVHLLALVGAAGQIAEDRQNRHFEMLGVTNIEPKEILEDRSAAAAGLGDQAVKLATGFVAIAILIQPFHAILASMMMAATAYGLGRLVLATARWTVLRFEKPWAGLSWGVAALAFLNIGVFMLAFTLDTGRGDYAGPFAWFCAAATASFVLWRGWNRNPAAVRPGRFYLNNHLWRAAMILASILAAIAVVADFDRSTPMVMVIQASPFGGLVCCGATAVDGRFLGTEFRTPNVLFTFVLAQFWTLLARRLDRSSLDWLEARMRERDAPARPALPQVLGRLRSRIAARLRLGAAT
jgi:ABC-type transport system involved in multi-copper enzyme maturation permease subunit